MCLGNPSLVSRTLQFNINDTVRVRLTKRGLEIHRKLYDDLAAYYGGKLPYPYRRPKRDREGWSEHQLWSLMQDFGPYISMTGEPPFETTIEIPQP